MLNWLKGVLHWTVSGVEDLWNKIVSVIQAVYSYIDAWVNQIVSDFSWLWNTFAGWINTIESWVSQVESYILGYIGTMYNDISSWVSRLIDDVYAYIGRGLQWLTDWVNRIVGYFTAWLNSLANWVITNIWDPLYNSITGIIRWIENEGAWVFYMITHPDQLAILLGKYILGAWVSLGRKYAGVTARWLLHGMMAAADDIAGIIEDFIAGIL